MSLPLNVIPVFYGRVANKRLKFDLPEDFTKYVHSLDGRRVEITIMACRRPRSLEQNKYFHSVVLPCFSEFTGNENYEMKLILKELLDVESTSALSREEMTDVIERCHRLAASIGLLIPDARSVRLR